MEIECFAFGGRRCSVLHEMVCANGKCPFFKTAEQLEAERMKAYKRLADMSPWYQKKLCDKYKLRELKNDR